ncbi:MAG TPA: RpiB/LacA/LacB family sugar-phosphate isomerase, partial [Candidatus Nanoarchaeia archaeon]|nr:RpiB/LacA/LacB family sugar-phosphate isomerase [Candidatus Nanoarchaeia archaeon]
EDCGASKLNKNDDYPVFAAKVAKNVSKHKSFGILFCGSSQGICIAANKVKGVRAVAVNSVKDAQLTRLHNDANVLCLSGWNTSKSNAEKIIKAFLFTLFSHEERHRRRIQQIMRLE